MVYKRYDVNPDKLQKLICGYRFNGKTLGKAIGVSYDTGRRRIECPEDLTVGELRKLMKHIPMDEILSAL